MGYNYGINSSDKYTGVELTFFPPDPWSGLYNLQRTAEDLTKNTLEKNYVAKQVADKFISKAQYYYDLKTPTSAMYTSFFGALRPNGDIVFGNSALGFNNQPYPTHLEYGFWNKKAGKRVPPHPIMRRAILDTMDLYYRIASQKLWDSYNEGALHGMLKSQIQEYANRSFDKYYESSAYTKRNNSTYNYKSRLKTDIDDNILEVSSFKSVGRSIL